MAIDGELDASRVEHVGTLLEDHPGLEHSQVRLGSRRCEFESLQPAGFGLHVIVQSGNPLSLARIDPPVASFCKAEVFASLEETHSWKPLADHWH